jgi:hypothetical protein
MGGIVFVGSMKGFEERLDKAFATKVSELMTADPVTSTTTRAPRRWRGRSPRSTTTTSRGRRRGPFVGMVTRADALAALVEE